MIPAGRASFSIHASPLLKGSDCAHEGPVTINSTNAPAIRNRAMIGLKQQAGS